MNLVAGTSRSLARPVRWVHVSEHVDPGPWISGGELVLTTGYNLHDEDQQRTFVDRLADSQVAGLGFGVGFDHREVPSAVVEASREVDLPLIRVPYDLPFISIIEDASSSLLEERHEALRRAQRVQAQLGKELIGGAGLERILHILATETQGSARVVDDCGRVLGSTPEAEWPEALTAELLARTQAGRVSSFSPEATGESGLAVPVPGRTRKAPPHWLVFRSASSGPPGDFEAHLANGCATICGIHRAQLNAVLEAQRRSSEDLLQSAIDGELPAGQVERRLESLGLAGELSVLTIETESPDAVVLSLDAKVKNGVADGLVAVARSGVSVLPCVVFRAEPDARVSLATGLLASARECDEEARAGLSSPRPGRDLARAFHEARCSVQATRSSEDPPALATQSDLGSLSLLFSMNDDETLRVLSSAVLGPVGPTDDQFTQELLSSLEVFIDCNGNWEKASRLLFCHRHTLRHRIKRIEELTGRDLSNSSDRFDCWVALKARDFVGGS